MLGLTGKGIGGLATGLDTDSLVAALTAGTKSKIAKQGQQKQLLNWKMTSYRTMATALSAFQSKSLKIGASGTNTNITSSSFFNTFKATTSSDKVSVSTTSSSMTGNFTIDSIEQLAESDKYSSINKLSSTLSLDIFAGKNVGRDAFTGQTLKLDVEGFATKTIKLDSLNYDPSNPATSAINSDGSINLANFQTKLQALIDDAYKSTSLVKVSKGDDGKIMLDSSSVKIAVNSDNNTLGVSAGDSNRVDTSSTIGSIDAFKNLQGDVMTFNINGVEISVSKSDKISTLMSKINNSGANVTMAYDKSNDKFTLTSKKTGADSKIEMRDVHGNLLNQIFGAQSGNGIGTDYLTTGTAVISDLINTIDGMTDEQRKGIAGNLKNMSFDLTINGVTKTVKLDTVLGISSDKLASGKYTSENVYNAINKGIQNAFYGSGVEFSKGADGRTVISSSQGEAFNVNISGQLGELVGINGNTGNIVRDYGYSNGVASSSSFKNFNGTNLQNGSFEMTINGVTKTVTLTQAKDANGNDIAITNDNILDRLNVAIKDAFGEETAKLVKFKGEYEYQTYDDDPNNRVLDANGKPIITGVKLSLTAANNGNGVVETSASIKATGGLFNSLGFSGTSATNANPGTGAKFSDIKGGAGVGSGTLTVTNGTAVTEVTYSAGETIQDFLKKLNTALGDSGVAGIKDGKLYIDSYGDTISITDKDASGNLKENRDADGNLIAGSVAGGMLKSVFGINGGSFTTQGASYTKYDAETNPSGTYKEFKNALVTIDGVERTFSSNNISHNNVNITLKDVSETAIKIGVQSDPEDVIKRIQDWMDDYNALVYTLNSAINEGKNRDYSPLTDEQKAEMTDDQVKTWETEAKKGILRNDQTLRGILSDMRNVFYQKVESAGISLYDIGIVTKSGLSDPNEAGQLEFDKNVTGGGEERLRKMLTENPDKVRMLFTDENGIGAQLNSIINRAANTSSVDRGTLVRLAGTEKLTGDNTSTLGDKISAIDKYIATLKSRMESEYNRYWKKFSALETSVQKMNSQSSWLQSQ